MFGAIRKLLSGGSSKNVAKSRLHFVLVQDRTGLSSEELSAFKKELVSVIEKYFVIDENGFDINYQRDEDTTTLLINSPILVRQLSSPSNTNGKKVQGAKATPAAANV